MRTPFVAEPCLVLVLLQPGSPRPNQPLGCGSTEKLSMHWTRVLPGLACVACDWYGPHWRHGCCGVPGPFSLPGHGLNPDSDSLYSWAVSDLVELHWL